VTASTFPAALAFVLSQEGGWSNDPDDPGGATNKGITLATYRLWNNDPKLSANQLRDITDAEVEAIYRTMYWDAVDGDEMPPGIDLSLMDFGVNAGPERSIRLLQEAIGTEPDGIIGPITQKAIDMMPAPRLLQALRDAQLTYYRELDTFAEFGDGWTNRTNARYAAAVDSYKAAMEGKTA